MSKFQLRFEKFKTFETIDQKSGENCIGILCNKSSFFPEVREFCVKHYQNFGGTKNSAQFLVNDI